MGGLVNHAKHPTTLGHQLWLLYLSFALNLEHWQIVNDMIPEAELGKETRT